MKTTTTQLNTIVSHLNSLGSQLAGDAISSHKHVITVGKRYARIAQARHGSTECQSVVCFVDMLNGDVLKPASWNKPAKHARGNVNNPDHGLGAFDSAGSVKYLR